MTQHASSSIGIPSDHEVERDRYTLSILALALSSPEVGRREYAMVISVVLIVMTVGVASLARGFGLRVGVRHQ